MQAEQTSSPTATGTGAQSPYEFSDYIEKRLGKTGIFSLYALRRGLEEPVAQRTQGAENFRRVFTALLQYNRPEAVKVLGYKVNTSRTAGEPNFVETFWLTTPEKREQALYGFSASGLAGNAAPNPDELRGQIFRDMSQQNEILRLTQQVQDWETRCHRMKRRLIQQQRELEAAQDRLHEKFKLESAVSKNLATSVGGLLMGVVTSVKPELGQKLGEALSGLELALPAPSASAVDAPLPSAPAFLDSATEAALEAISKLPEDRRLDAVRVLHVLANNPQHLDDLIHYLDNPTHADTQTDA